MRYIARLDLKSDYLIKSIRYEGLRNLGKPEKYAKEYYESGITEILLIDNVASLYRRDPFFEIIKRISNNILVPLIFCGGLRTLKNVEKAFEAGSDKIALNTILFENKSLITQVAEKFGQQSVIVSIEAKKTKNNSWECFCYNGRERTKVDVINWAQEVESLGAGEILLSSVDFDGTHLGFDVELAKNVVEAVNIPVVVGSGAGSIKDIKLLFEKTNPSGVCIGSALHYKNFTINDLIKLRTSNE
jgi:cyclase